MSIIDTMTKKDNEPALRRAIKKIVPLIQLSDMNDICISEIRRAAWRIEELIEQNNSWHAQKKESLNTSPNTPQV